MPENPTDLAPINFDALERAHRRHLWEKDPRIIIQDIQYPYSEDPDPAKRIEAQGIQLTDRAITEVDDSPRAAFDEAYERYETGRKIYIETQAIENAKRTTKLHLRDLEAQHVLVGTEHEIYSVLRRVDQRITEAEQRLLKENVLSRATTTNEFDFYVTRRTTVNAYTIPGAKNAFFEAGIFSLLNSYLSEHKGYGIAEDHIALVLAHEISHSDPEAETGYMNEEYYDVQGMILGAEAGYNPQAAVDVEDFLIWLNENTDDFEIIDAEVHTSKKAFSLSHPNPKHRRSVLLQVLNDDTRVLPNQSKQFTNISSEVIDSLHKEMSLWQQEAEQRVLPLSGVEALSNIRDSGDLSQLLDALQGLQIYEKAALTRELMQDSHLINLYTLIEAISFQLHGNAKGQVELGTEEMEYLSSDIRRIINAYKGLSFDTYGAADIVIGGLASNLSDNNTFIVSSDVANGCLNDLNQISATISKRSQSDIWQQTSETTVNQAARDLNMQSFLIAEKINRLFRHILNTNAPPDLDRLLAGDFSQDLTLAALLQAVGITSFDNYLDGLAEKLESLSPHPKLLLLQSERSTKLFSNLNNLTRKGSSWDESQVSSLLSRTLPYRMAVFSDRVNNRMNVLPGDLQLSDEVLDLVNTKLSQFAGSLSQTADEQKLYHMLLHTSLNHDQVSEYLQQQIVALMSGKPCNRSLFTLLEAEGVGETLQNLRIAPAIGGDLLKNLLWSGQFKTGYRIIDDLVSDLKQKLDFVRLYKGELEHHPANEDEGHDKATFSLKPRVLADKVALEQKKKTMIPVSGTDFAKYKVAQPPDSDIDIEHTYMDFEKLITLAKASAYQAEYLEKIVTYDGISEEQIVEYILHGMETGEFTLQMFVDVFKFKWAIIPSETQYIREAALTTEKTEGVYVPQVTQQQISLERRKYRVATALLKQLPTSPIPQLSYDSSGKINERLFTGKIKLAKYDFLRAQNNTGTFSYEELASVNLYEHMTVKEAARAKLRFILEFVNEGGTVNLEDERVISSHYRTFNVENKTWGLMRNIGAAVNLQSIIKDMDYPVQEISSEVHKLFEHNAQRFTQAEIDKWLSLIAYTQQPDFGDLYTYRGQFRLVHPTGNLQLKVNNEMVFFDKANADHLLLALDQVLQMPLCSYRDYCLGLLHSFLPSAIQYEVPRPNLKRRISPHSEEQQANIWSNSELADFYKTVNGVDRYDHPARAHLEQKLTEAFISQFSPRGIGLIDDTDNDSFSRNLARVFIPLSEDLAGDVVAGFYVHQTPASTIWGKLIQEEHPATPRTPFSKKYRHQPKFNGMNSEFVEKSVLYDRLRLLEQMPDSELKEAMTLYSLQTALENMHPNESNQHFHEELTTLIKHFSSVFVTPQSRQKLFDLRLKTELGIKEGEITDEEIRTHFTTRDDFLNYIVQAIPEKTAFRDSYILLATELYPLRVGDARNLRKLLFNSDYGTQNKMVLLQRTGLEIARVIKENQKYHPRHAKELILWLIDEDLQIKSFDELFHKLTSNKAGRRLIRSVINESSTRIGSDIEETDSESYKTKLKQYATDIAIEALLRLPYSIKKKIVVVLLNRNTAFIEESAAFISRLGMPSILTLLNDFNNRSTFNSLLESSNFDNPTAKNMFFDLMLGEKGLLEEPVVVDASRFVSRMQSGFEGSQMHAFINDLVDLAVRRAGLNDRERFAMQVVAHSLIECMSPPRRATVLYRLISELKKIDFDDTDQVALRSQILTVALSSFGVLGAKLGQIDELIPDRWEVNASSFKHATSPMPLLKVADLFRIEGLSDDYTLIASSGAASTASGYIVKNPHNEHQFVKIVRPEVILDWFEDFKAVEHMIQVLQSTGILRQQINPIISQLKKLVEEELQTGREINNVVQYVNAETDEERRKRSGIRAINMPLSRIGKDGTIVETPQNSLMIFAEPLRREQGFIELSRLQTSPELSRQIDLRRVYTIILDDFFYRALELGVWHADPHEGNIFVNIENGVIRKEVTNEDLMWIDFGQIGSVEREEKRNNAARLLAGLSLFDRDEIAAAIYAGLVDTSGKSPQMIKAELSTRPSQLQKSTLKVMSKYGVEDYMTNFMKAMVNILPYLRQLPVREQYSLIARYIPQEVRQKLRTKFIESFIQQAHR